MPGFGCTLGMPGVSCKRAMPGFMSKFGISGFGCKPGMCWGLFKNTEHATNAMHHERKTSIDV